jgi:ABC-2 type transport system ATP-binding protein
MESYSRGMKQRVHLASGLIVDEGVLFLDEPTNGMGPIAALRFPVKNVPDSALPCRAR